jgi:methylated-DNA-[protein]-cysteine S-methyltransferase
MLYTVIDFPKGRILLAKTQKGLSLAHFIRNEKDLEENLSFLKQKSPSLQKKDSAFQQEKKLFKKYFKGIKEDFTSLQIDPVYGTPYQIKVWNKARKIPFGKTETYKSIAHKLNHKGYRSIGQALSKNPLLIVIPCHRVLGSHGSLGGFSAGLELKKYLLGLEDTEPPA